MKLLFKILALNILLSYFLSGQKQIEIIGNYKTKSHIIIQEFKHGNLDSISNNDLILYQNKLLELDIFNDVKILSTDSSYTIYVVEKSNFEPMPLIERNETLGWSYGVGFKLNNINGLNKKFTFNTLGGAIESYQLNYFSPDLLLQSYPFYIDIHKTSRSSVENTYLLNQYNLSTNLFAIKINNINNCAFNLVLFNYKLFYNSNNSIESFKGFIPSISLNRKSDNSKFDFIMQYYFFKNSTNQNYLNLNIYNFNKLYFSTNKNIYLIFKNNFNLNFAKNIPEYNKIYVGGEDGVRAYEENPLLNSEEIQNNLKTQNLIFSSIELAIPFWKHHLFQTHLLVFFDYAIHANEYDNFNLNNNLYGYGFGFKNKFLNQQTLDLYIGINPNGNKIINFVVETN